MQSRIDSSDLHRRFMDQGTVDKMQILDSNYLPTLLKYMEPEVRGLLWGLCVNSHGTSGERRGVDNPPQPLPEHASTVALLHRGTMAPTMTAVPSIHHHLHSHYRQVIPAFLTGGKLTDPLNPSDKECSSMIGPGGA